MPDPNLRAADSDRAAAAAALGKHLSEGRLTVEEYDERLAKAYAAKTFGELEELFVDLPRPVAPPRPAAEPAAAAPVMAGPSGMCGRGRGGRNHLRASWSGWITTALIVTTIWLITTLNEGFHYFWPIWVIGPWGAVLLARTLTGQPHHSGRRRLDG